MRDDNMARISGMKMGMANKEGMHKEHQTAFE